MQDFLTIVAVLLFSGGMACASSADSPHDDLRNILPDPPAGWQIDGDDEYYDSETIFHYMNGAGEVYLSYDYRGMAVRRFVNDSGQAITVELYDMGNGEDAFGIFTRNRQGESAGIGQGSEFRSGYLVFWKGQYFSSVYTFEETEEAKEAVLESGRSIAESITENASLPALISLLPERGLEKQSIRFFHTYTDLNQHYFLADENILNLGKGVDAALGAYEGDSQYPPLLLLVQYPDEEQARLAAAAFAEQFLQAAEADIRQLEDGTWSGYVQWNEYFACVFDGDSESQVRSLLKQTVSQ